MTPRGLIKATAAVFAGCVVACIATYVATHIEQLSSLEPTRLFMRIVTMMIFLGLAGRMGAGMVRGCSVERWTTVLAATVLAVGIFKNSGERPAAGLIVLAASFALCAVALLTPFAGRHFAATSNCESGTQPFK